MKHSFLASLFFVPAFALTTSNLASAEEAIRIRDLGNNAFELEQHAYSLLGPQLSEEIITLENDLRDWGKDNRRRLRFKESDLKKAAWKVENPRTGKPYKTYEIDGLYRRSPWNPEIPVGKRYVDFSELPRNLQGRVRSVGEKILKAQKNMLPADRELLDNLFSHSPETNLRFEGGQNLETEFFAHFFQQTKSTIGKPRTPGSGSIVRRPIGKMPIPRSTGIAGVYSKLSKTGKSAAKSCSKAGRLARKSGKALAALGPVAVLAAVGAYATDAYAYSCENNVEDSAFEQGLEAHPDALKKRSSTEQPTFRATDKKVGPTTQH